MERHDQSIAFALVYFTSPVYEQKSSLVKLSSFHLFDKNVCSPPLKSLPCCKIGSRVFDGWYYIEKYQRKRVACYCYQKLRQTNFFKKNFGKCSQIGCFKVRNSTRKTLTIGQSPSNGMLQNKSFTGEITENLASTGKYAKLFDYTRTPLKRFLACLTFHRKEIGLRHLHKRTNPGSAPAIIIFVIQQMC